MYDQQNLRGDLRSIFLAFFMAIPKWISVLNNMQLVYLLWKDLGFALPGQMSVVFTMGEQKPVFFRLKSW